MLFLTGFFRGGLNTNAPAGEDKAFVYCLWEKGRGGKRRTAFASGILNAFFGIISLTAKKGSIINVGVRQ